MDFPLLVSSPSLFLPVRGDLGKYEEWDGEAKFTWQHQISGLERTEEDPEAEFLTSRRLMRDISAT